jgi:hypothetical protein
MLSENKKEFPSPFLFRPTGGCGPSLRSLPTPRRLCRRSATALQAAAQLGPNCRPAYPAHQPPWPCASSRLAHPSPDPQLLQCPWRTRLAPLPTSSSASVPCTPRQRRLHRPIKAERPSLARPALRFVLARSLAPTKPPPPAVLNPPAMEPTGANRRRREACDAPPDVHRPPWRREATCAPPLHGRPSRPTATFRRRRITAASHRLSHR